MLTNTDIRRELDAAGIGPVVEIAKLAELIGSGKSMLYHLIALRSFGWIAWRRNRRRLHR